MPLKLKIEVDTTFPSCNSIVFEDTTPDYDVNKNLGGYGSPNPSRADVVRTEIYATAPGNKNKVLLDVDYLPTDEPLAITCKDYLDSLEIDEDSESSDVTDDDCELCKEKKISDISLKLHDDCKVKTGCWSDGCWIFEYRTFGEGNSSSYDLTGVTFPNAFRITINGTVYNLGYVIDIGTLVDALNMLDLGTFDYSGTTVTAEGINTFGILEWKYVVFADSGASVSYPRQEIAYINSIIRNLGSIGSLPEHITALNDLNLGYWDDSTSEFVAYGFNNYGDQAYGQVFYDNSAFTYGAATSSITINGSNYPLGAATSVNQLIENLNLLNLGIFTYDSGANQILCISPFTLTALSVGATTTAVPDGGEIGTYTPTVYSGTITPTNSTDDILLASTEVEVKFYCNIAQAISDIGMKSFESNCNCNGQDMQAVFNQLNNDFQTMILVGKRNACNCKCFTDWLRRLEKKVTEINNQCWK